MKRRQCGQVTCHLSGLRHTVKEINDPSFQRILGTHDQDAPFLDQLLEDFGSVSHLMCRGANVRANSVPQKGLRIVAQLRRE